MVKIVCTGILGTVLFLCIIRASGQDRILVADDSLNEESENLTSQNEVIPEALLIRMKDVHNVSEFLRLFATPVTEEDNTTLNARPDIKEEEAMIRKFDLKCKNLPRRISEEYKYPNVRMHDCPRRPKLLLASPYENKRPRQSAVSTASIAQPANCQTEQHVVQLDKPENGATIYWPSCVRVHRCGGCCTSNMLACKPLSISLLNVTVLQMQYNPHNPGALEAQGTKVFSLEQHDQCSCSCKERQDDCNLDVHEYRGDECRCVCKNNEVAASCTGPKKIWDSKDCICKCRNVRMCSTGRYFNIVNCRCDILRRSLAVGNFDRRNTTLARSSNITLNESHSLQ